MGLGKTLIAKGMIARLAKLRLEEQGPDRLFKVVYICSNATIAGQNLNKLRISPPAVRTENTASSRLSMQHLNIFLQNHDPEVLKAMCSLSPPHPPGDIFSAHSGGRHGSRKGPYVCPLKAAP